MLTNWGGEAYKEAALPDHMSAEESTHFAKRYKFLKEEFYRHSGCQVVTPQNARVFLQVHRRWAAITGKELRWDFVEQWSCSGRASSIHSFVVRKSSHRGTPLARTARPTAASLP